MAKKKEEAKNSTSSTVMNVFSVLGGMLLLGSVMPFVPWRYALANGNLGARFVSDRKYSLFTAGNNFGQGVSWLKLRRNMCMKMEEYVRPDPLKALAGIVSAKVGAGGALLGCIGWEACKSHVATRCYTYATIGILGIFCMLCNLTSAVLGFLSPVMQNMEPVQKKKNISKKKKKALVSAQYATMMISIAGFILAFFSTCAWIGVTGMQFKNLQATGYYPWPGANAGMGVAGLGCFCMFIGMICGITRRKGEDDFKKEEEGGDAENEEYDAAEGPAPELAGNPLFGGLPPPP